MKNSIYIRDRVSGLVTIETDPRDPGAGLLVRVELGSASLAFGMEPGDARKLAEALKAAADELEGETTP